MKIKNLLLIVLLVSSQMGTAQIFKDWQWGDETEVYNEDGTRVTISFYKSPQSCDPGGKSSRYRFNVTGTLQANYKSIEVKFDYRNCQGNTVAISQNLNVGSGGQLGSIEGIDYKFTGTAILKVYKVPLPGQYTSNTGQGQPFYFFDDFSDNKNNWFIGETKDYTVKIEANKYIIIPALNSSRYSYQSKLDIDCNKDFTAEVITKWVDGATSIAFGIDFTGNATVGSFYNFSISSNGYYTLMFIENNGNWKQVVPWTSSSVVNQGNVPNILKVVKEGNYLSLFINDTFLKKIPFDGGYGCSFGLRTASSDTQTQTVEFSKFKLTGYKK